MGSLIFPPLPTSPSSSRKPSISPTTIYDTSHQFFGDLNFYLDLPETRPLYGPGNRDSLILALNNESKREELKEYDQLRMEQKKGTVLVGLREGDFWKFKVRPRIVLRVTILTFAVRAQLWDWRSRQMQVGANFLHDNMVLISITIVPAGRPLGQTGCCIPLSPKGL